jgi:hypothetical protein
MAALAVCILLPGCTEQTAITDPVEPAFIRAPSDGNGNKQVIVFDFDVASPFTCPGGEELRLHAAGWIQVRLFPQSDRQVELDVFHTVHTWSNSDGETFVDHEIGPDHYYLDQDGNLVVASTGKLTFAGIIGRLVVNLDTGDVLFLTGPGFPDHLVLACNALT